MAGGLSSTLASASVRSTVLSFLPLSLTVPTFVVDDPYSSCSLSGFHNRGTRYLVSCPLSPSHIVGYRSTPIVPISDVPILIGSILGSVMARVREGFKVRYVVHLDFSYSADRYVRDRYDRNRRVTNDMPRTERTRNGMTRATFSKANRGARTRTRIVDDEREPSMTETRN